MGFLIPWLTGGGIALFGIGLYRIVDRADVLGHGGTHYLLHPEEKENAQRRIWSMLLSKDSTYDRWIMIAGIVGVVAGFIGISLLTTVGP